MMVGSHPVTGGECRRKRTERFSEKSLRFCPNKREGHRGLFISSKNYHEGSLGGRSWVTLYTMFPGNYRAFLGDDRQIKSLTGDRQNNV